MDYRYGELPLDLLQSLLSYEELLKLFLDLVSRLGGDVEEAMQWMQELQRRGIIGKDVDLEAFRMALEKQGIVGRDGEGNLTLLGPGERRIRRNALEEIFSSLQKAGPGLHSIPRAGVGSETLPETRPYEFGDDPARLDGIRIVANATPRRTTSRPPVRLRSSTSRTRGCAATIAIDVRTR